MTNVQAARPEVGTNRDGRDERDAKDGHGRIGRMGRDGANRPVRSAVNGLDFAGESRKKMGGELQSGKLLRGVA